MTIAILLNLDRDILEDVVICNEDPFFWLIEVWIDRRGWLISSPISAKHPKTLNYEEFMVAGYNTSKLCVNSVLFNEFESVITCTLSI